MTKGSVYLMTSIDKWINYGGEYYYNKELTDGINQILNVGSFECISNDMNNCLNYFKNNKELVARIVWKRLIPFKKLESANEILKHEIVRISLKAKKNNLIDKFELEGFADSYIKYIVRMDLLELFKKIEESNKDVIENFINEL
jgi:hypothetical protein